MERSIRVRRKPEVWLVERHLIDEEEDLIVKSELPYPILKVMICAANLAQFHSVWFSKLNIPGILISKKNSLCHSHESNSSYYDSFSRNVEAYLQLNL